KKPPAFIFASNRGRGGDGHRSAGRAVPYEKRLRVPLIIRYPPLARGGRQQPQLVLNIDLAPTIAALAHVPVAPGTDGQSLVPLLRGASGGWRTDFLFEYFANPGETQPSFAGGLTPRWQLTTSEGPSDDDLPPLTTHPSELPSAHPGQQPVAQRLERLFNKRGGGAARAAAATAPGEAR